METGLGGYHQWARTFPTPVTDGLKRLYRQGIRRVWLNRWLFDQLDWECQLRNPYQGQRPPKPYGIYVYGLKAESRESRNP